MEPTLYKILRPILTVIFKILYRPTIIGSEYLKDNIPLVLAGNHTSNLDCILLISSTKRCVHFLAKDSLNKGIKKIIFKNMGIIPVNRKIHDKDALNNGIKSLKENKLICVFPEGTINKTKDIIMPFKIGAVKMAHDTNSHIVPFTITKKYKMFRKSVTLTFYKPYKIDSDDLTKANNDIMNMIATKLKESR